MRHIITGGSGFTGSYLTSALVERGERVVIFDLKDPAVTSESVNFVRGDVREAGDLRKLSLRPDDVVYHLAARQFHLHVPHQNRDAWFAEVNVGGTRNIIEAMKAGHTQRLVFFSTDMTYGIPSGTPIAPSHAQVPIGPYGRSKVQAERLLIEACKQFNLRASIFRPRLIAGAGRLGILSKLFRLIRTGLPVPLIGAGVNRYQMISVEDCVAAALAAVEKDCPPGPFNLGSEAPPTVRELLSELIKRTGSSSVLIPTPATALKILLSTLDHVGLTLLYPEQFTVANVDYILDTSDTTKRLGWTPRKRDIDIMHEAYKGFLASTKAV